MTNNPAISTVLASLIAEAWPGTTLATEPTPLAGGFWASMYRLQLAGEPPGIPPAVVFRIAPDPAMGAKELAVQRTIAELGLATPRVRLSGPVDERLGGSWSVMDFAAGSPPLGDLNGIAALRRAPALFTHLPVQLATAMAEIHAIHPEPISAAVEAAAPSVAWRVEDLLEHFEAGADALGRSDLSSAVRSLADRRTVEGPTVICHGDLHPFNLLVNQAGEVTVVDWTAATRAEPAYDVAFTALLLANPPLDAPGPLGGVIRWVGGRLERRFVARYRALAPRHDLGSLDWYQALHSARILIEAASIEARHGTTGGHPFGTLIPFATAALSAATDTPVVTHR